MRPLEDFFAYPGSRLMKTLADRIAADDALGAARLVRRISGALLSGSYRYESGEWETSDDDDDAVPERLGQTFEGGESTSAVLRDPVRHAGAGRQRGRSSPTRFAACGASRTR